MQFMMVRRRLLLLVLSLVFVSWAKSMASAEEGCNFAEGGDPHRRAGTLIFARRGALGHAGTMGRGIRH